MAVQVQLREKKKQSAEVLQELMVLMSREDLKLVMQQPAGVQLPLASQLLK
jgi:hypothetical protein